ncbi:MAG: hypothetical protein DRJ65_21490 [Acidobacteria bacterium]|nr:MAG: hypothetical protein DRJ65_21490 [Acidobacteriota bacterium]
MRVAVDARPLAEPPNGIRRWLECLLGAMPEAAPDIEWVLIVPNDGIAPPKGLNARVVVVPGSLRSLLRPAWETLRLPGALRRSGADALLSSYGIVPPWCPMPTVSVVHDLAFLKWPRLLPLRHRWYWRWVIRSVRRAAAVVVPSTATRRAVVERLGINEENIRLVPHAAGAVFAPAGSEIRADVRQRFGLSGAYVLAVGTLEPRKNLGTLVAAMDGVNAGSEEEVPLVLVGRKGWGEGLVGRSWLRHIVDADDGALAALYSETAVFAMPSLDEGFGLPALEAMACGAPVVVADAGALPEVVGDAGLTVPPEDVEGWAGALLRVLGDQESADDMRRRSLERARAFSWTQSARAVAEILRSVKK